MKNFTYTLLLAVFFVFIILASSSWVNPVSAVEKTVYRKAAKGAEGLFFSFGADLSRSQDGGRRRMKTA